jgi:hypothetical protein
VHEASKEWLESAEFRGRREGRFLLGVNGGER